MTESDLENTITVPQDNILAHGSVKIPVLPNQRYLTSAKVKALNGLPYSAYFFVVVLDSKDQEITRCIRWINDFETAKDYQIVFTTPANAVNSVLGYRINDETPVRGEMKVVLQDVSTLKLEKTELENSFDNINSFEVPYLTPLDEKSEKELENRVVWLFGSPRSGTTWLAVRLLNNPANLIWNESWFGYHLGALINAEHARSMEGCDEESEIQPKFKRIFDVQKNNGYYFFAPHHKNNWMPYLRKLLLARIYSFSQTLEKNIILKEPTSSHAADIITECLPESRLIFLSRDGRDVVESRMDMHSTNSWAKLSPLKTPEERLLTIHEYAHIWNINVEKIFDAYNKHDPSRRLWIRYEDLLTDTFSQLRKIYDFIKVGIDDSELKEIVKRYDFTNIPDSEKGPGKFNRVATSGGWKYMFTQHEQNVMNRIMSKNLKMLGYDV